MDKLLFILSQKLAVLLVVSATGFGALITNTTATIPAASTAIIANQVTTPQLLPVDPALVPGLLPTTTIPFCPASSACATKALRALVAGLPVATAPLLADLANAPSPLLTNASLQAAANEIGTSSLVRPIAKPPVIAIPVAAPVATLSASDMLADTTFSLKEVWNGLFELKFTTTNGSAALPWDLSMATIGGTDGVPTLSTTYSCSPGPQMPVPGAFDQNPGFLPRTQYSCTISVTPTSGADQRTQSKSISFSTPPGQLVVSADANMDQVLTDGENDGGITFNNEDTTTSTIRGLTIDVSFTDFNLLNGPLVLRVIDPATGQTISDYHLEKAPVDPSTPYTNTQTGIVIPLNFAIPAQHQKMLPIEILNVQKMLMQGSTPQITVTVKNVQTAESGVKTNLSSPVVHWQCTVALGGYNPNATGTDVFGAAGVCGG